MSLAHPVSFGCAVNTTIPKRSATSSPERSARPPMPVSSASKYQVSSTSTEVSMADPTQNNPNAEKPMARADRPLRRADEGGYPGVTPSRDPDHDGDRRAHHEVAASHGTASPHHHPDPRGLR